MMLKILSLGAKLTLLQLIDGISRKVRSFADFQRYLDIYCHYSPLNHKVKNEYVDSDLKISQCLELIAKDGTSYGFCLAIKLLEFNPDDNLYLLFNDYRLSHRWIDLNYMGYPRLDSDLTLSYPN